MKVGSAETAVAGWAVAAGAATVVEVDATVVVVAPVGADAGHGTIF